MAQTVFDPSEVTVQSKTIVLRTADGVERGRVKSDGTGSGLLANAYFTVTDPVYGADPTGVADSTAAIQAAMNACGVAGGGTVFLPAGTFKISSTLVFNYGGVRLRGAGWGQFAHAAAYAPDVSATTLSWAGGVTSAAKMISANHVGQISVEDLTLTGNRGIPVGFAGATYGIYWLDVISSMIRNVSVKLMQLNGNAAGTIDSICLYMAGTASGGGSYFNVIENVTLNGATGLYLDGDAGTGNDVTESTFRGVLVAYGSNTGNADGIIINYGDGNDFFHIDCIHNFGSGYGMRFKSNARANRFFGVAVGPNGLYVEAPASATFKSTIYGYSRQDNIPAPTGPGVSAVDWIEVQGTGTAASWQINSPINNPGSSFFNVKGYGAVGDGTTDDTAAVQAAINAAAAAGGGTVFFPAGTYKVTSTLTVTTSGVHLCGVSQGRRAAGNQPQPATPSKLQWAGSAPGPIVVLRNMQAGSVVRLALDGGKPSAGANAATYGIQLLGTDLCTIERVSIDNLQLSGVSGGTQDSVGIFVCAWSPDGGATVVGSQFNRLLYCNVNGSRMVQIGDAATSGGIHNSTIGYIAHLTGSFTTDAGIYIFNGDDWTIVHPYCFSSGSGYGLVLDAYARNNTVLHPFFYGGVHALAPGVAEYGNTVIGFYRAEGSAGPVLDTGSRLDWTEHSSSAWGWHLDRGLWQRIYSIPYTNGGVSPVPGAKEGPWQQINVTDASSFSINNPVTTPAAPETSFTRDLVIEIKNSSGGAMGTVTFGGQYVIFGAFTSPASTKARWIKFQFNSNKWVEIARASADYTPGW